MGSDGDARGTFARCRIAIFDYDVSETSPSGSCHLRLLEGLSGEFDFTVFATTFDNPDPTRIQWVWVPAVTRPLAARFVSYYLASTAGYRRRRQRTPFDVVQTVEGYTGAGDIRYVHFCHRAYLRRHWAESGARGFRGAARRLDHQLRAANEGPSLRAARLIVVPSPGLIEDLVAEHRIDPSRIRVVPNPVDLAKLNAPPDFARVAQRQALGAGPEDLVVVFVALGHFERKGLPALLEAVKLTAEPRVRLVVVGGQPDLVSAYRSHVSRMGLAGRVRFTGLQSDVRPFLWAADVFASPSTYEVFSLAPLQAAGAGLPLIVTPIAGVAPFFQPERHGIAVTRQPAIIADALTRMAKMDLVTRRALGAQARQAVRTFDVPAFLQAWRSIYCEALATDMSN